MALFSSDKIRTPVEELFMNEMVEEDTELTLMGEEDYEAINDMVDDVDKYSSEELFEPVIEETQPDGTVLYKDDDTVDMDEPVVTEDDISCKDEVPVEEDDFEGGDEDAEL